MRSQQFSYIIACGGKKQVKNLFSSQFLDTHIISFLYSISTYIGSQTRKKVRIAQKIIIIITIQVPPFAPEPKQVPLSIRKPHLSHIQIQLVLQRWPTVSLKTKLPPQLGQMPLLQAVEELQLRTTVRKRRITIRIEIIIKVADESCLYILYSLAAAPRQRGTRRLILFILYCYLYVMCTVNVDFLYAQRTPFLIFFIVHRTGVRSTYILTL